MLRITFTSPGGEPQIFEMAGMEELRASEAELIEDSGGRQWDTFMEWSLQMAQGSFRACRVLLWVLLRRANPSLTLDELDFPVGSLLVEETEDDPPTTAKVSDLEARLAKAIATGDTAEADRITELVESAGKDEPGDSDTSSP